MPSFAVNIPERPQDPNAAEQWMLQYRDQMKMTNIWPTNNAIPQISAVRWCIAHQEDYRRS